MTVFVASILLQWSELKQHSLWSMPMKGLCNRGGGLVAKSPPTLVTPQTTACQAPLSMGFSRQEYQSGLPFPSPEDLSNPGIKLGSPALQTDTLPTKLWGKPQKLRLIGSGRNYWWFYVTMIQSQTQLSDWTEYGIKTRKLTMVQCVCKVLYHSITAIGLCNQHYS